MTIVEIKNRYGFFYKIYLAYCLIKTKLLFHSARLIRFPISIRGKVFIFLGRNLTTGINCRIKAFSTGNDNKYKIIFGDRIQLNDYVHISALDSIEIGDDVLVASHVYISDNSHGSYKGDENDTSPEIPPIKRPYFVSPVKIGSKVWLGEGVIVMPGVTIGDGAIIGAHSIVNRDIPANSIAVGSPAKIVKHWDENMKKWVKIK